MRSTLFVVFFALFAALALAQNVGDMTDSVGTVVEKTADEQRLPVEPGVVEDTTSGVEQMPPVEEKPGVEQMPPVEEKPGVEQMPPVEEKPGVEQMPPVEEKPGVEQMPPVEDKPAVDETAELEKALGDMATGNVHAVPLTSAEQCAPPTTEGRTALIMADQSSFIQGETKVANDASLANSTVDMSKAQLDDLVRQYDGKEPLVITANDRVTHDGVTHLSDAAFAEAYARAKTALRGATDDLREQCKVAAYTAFKTAVVMPNFANCVDMYVAKKIAGGEVSRDAMAKMAAQHCAEVVPGMTVTENKDEKDIADKVVDDEARAAEEERRRKEAAERAAEEQRAFEAAELAAQEAAAQKERERAEEEARRAAEAVKEAEAAERKAAEAERVAREKAEHDEEEQQRKVDVIVADELPRVEVKLRMAEREEMTAKRVHDIVHRIVDELGEETVDEVRFLLDGVIKRKVRPQLDNLKGTHTEDDRRDAEQTTQQFNEVDVQTSNTAGAQSMSSNNAVLSDIGANSASVESQSSSSSSSSSSSNDRTPVYIVAGVCAAIIVAVAIVAVVVVSRHRSAERRASWSDAGIV